MRFYATRSPSSCTHFSYGLIGALVAVALATDSSAQEKRTIQANDLYNIKTAAGVTLSPDGRRVAYVVTQIDSAENSYRSHIWIASSDGRDVRQFTRGPYRDRAPAWSPDASKIAFVSNRAENESQIYILPTDGGEAWQLTDMESGASDPVWSPDGGRLLFSSSLTTAELEGDSASPVRTAAASDGEGMDGHSMAGDTAMFGSMEAIRNWLAVNASEGEPEVITRLRFQGERSLDPIESWSHIFSISLEEKVPTRLTEGSYSYGDASFSSDGSLIAVTANIPEGGIHPDFSWKSDLFVMDADGGNLRKIEIPTHNVSSAAWAPSGNGIAVVGRDTAEITAVNNELGVIEVSDGETQAGVRWLSRSLDRSVRAYRWSPDGRWLYFTASVHGTVPIYRVSLRNGETRQVVSGERGVVSFHLAERRLAYAVTEPSNPSEVFSADADGDSERRLTTLNSNWLSSVHVQPHEGFWYHSFDGRRVHAWMIKPVGYQPNKTYPLALEIHGGPHAMWGPGEQTMWHEFQLLAANGYMVLYTNPRGSDGYGDDFKLTIQRDWGDGPMNDVLTAVDTAVARGAVDQDRMVVTGGSYAGYLTAYIIGHDHRFKAAVAQRGVYDLATFFGEGNAWRLVPFEFNAYPWEDPEILREESPITYAHEIQTPFLIMHSSRDLRTGVSQSEMLYRTLKVLERPVEYVRYPRAGHDLSRSGEPLLRIDRLLRILEFFDRHVSSNQ